MLQKLLTTMNDLLVYNAYQVTENYFILPAGAHQVCMSLDSMSSCCQPNYFRIMCVH